VNIPTFSYPDAAARVFDYMWRYTDNLRLLFETPSLPLPGEHGGRDTAARILAAARGAGRTILTEIESKQLLAAYGIPTVPTRVARTEGDAVSSAREMGFPVVVKLHSETITHKSDVGGVKLGLRDVAAVREAYRQIEAAVAERAGREHFQGVTVQPMVKLDGYELILGSSVDAQFGPVLLFGSGGVLVEVYQDRALGLPPLTTTLARRMIERTKIAAALRGTRGRPPVDVSAVERLLVTFSHLIVEHPVIAEADINPLLASHERLVALDARFVLHPAGVPDERLPRPAIRPYPTEYVSTAQMKDGASVTIRPIRPEDEPQLVRFHETLSDRTVYLRYLEHLKLDQRTSHHRLARVCFIDYDREVVLVAEGEDGKGERALLGVGRLNRGRRRDQAEFALLIADSFQGRGLGSAMLRRLLDIGRAEGLRRITAEIAQENGAMQAVCKRLGFKLKDEVGEPTLRAAIEL
jgi:acetyltransferase